MVDQKMKEKTVRTELFVTGGVYKGRYGYVDKSRGNQGFSSTGKSIFIIYIDDDDNEKTAPYSIRKSSATECCWSDGSKIATVLQRHPDIAKKTAELCKLLQKLNFDNKEEYNQFGADFAGLLSRMLQI
jgi:hypothetical protein